MTVSKPSRQPSAPISRYDEELTRLAPHLSAVRRHLHQHPELSGAETATTSYLAQQLEEANIPYRLTAGKTGIITGIIPAAEAKAPCLALRADIDALPIAEENEVPYRSQNEGTMHACGHDAHSAILLGTTLALRRAGPLPVSWRGIFQPSEEMGHGARGMVKQGAVKGTQAIIALHVDPTLPVGQVCITPGPQTALCQDFTIEVQGRGGHGARPHLTIDPIAVAAQLITLIYQAVPRSTDAREPIVVTIGAIEGGHANNIIPDRVTMKGTIRSFDLAVSTQARETVQRLCAGTAQSFRAKITPVFTELLNGVVNDPHVTSVCLQAARELLGTKNVIDQRCPSLGAEDFADYLTDVPGCMILLGVKSPGKKVTPLHTSRFDIDEKALLVGARLLGRIVLNWPI